MTGINLDYIILNVSLNPKIDWDFFRFPPQERSYQWSIRLEEYGTKIFRKVAKIYYGGNEFATMTYQPYCTELMGENFGQIQIANKYLYIPIQSTGGIIQDFCYRSGIEVTGLNRLDIAIDADKSEGSFKYILFNLKRELDQKEAIFCGKEKALTYYSTSKNEDSGWAFGNRSSDRYLRFYNKTKEMGEGKNKPWIRKYWKYDLGINDDANVWRLEIQLNRRYLKDIADVWRIFDYKFIWSMFQISMENFFDLRENLNKNRETRNPKIKYLQDGAIKDYLDNGFWPKISILGNTGKYYPAIRTISQVEENTILQNKIQLKKMFTRYCHSGQESLLPLYLIKEIFEVNQSFYELAFFTRKRDYWIQQYKAEKDLHFVFDAQKFQQDLKFIEKVSI